MAKLNLQNSVTSPQDLKEIVLGVRKYAHWFSQPAVKMQVTKVNNEEPPALSQPTVTLIKEWVKEVPLSQTSLDGLIAALEDLEATAPRVTITLAAPPTNKIKTVLVEWFREHIGQNVLVDIRFNSTLLGGMVVQYSSHVYDWSFRRQILASRTHFPEVLRRV